MSGSESSFGIVSLTVIILLTIYSVCGGLFEEKDVIYLY